MSALAEALVAAQRRSLAAVEKAYVAGQIAARWGLGGAESPREGTES